MLTGAGVDAERRRSAAASTCTTSTSGTELVTYHTGHRGDALLIGVE